VTEWILCVNGKCFRGKLAYVENYLGSCYYVQTESGFHQSPYPVGTWSKAVAL